MNAKSVSQIIKNGEKLDEQLVNLIIPHICREQNIQYNKKFKYEIWHNKSRVGQYYITKKSETKRTIATTVWKKDIQMHQSYGELILKLRERINLLTRENMNKIKRKRDYDKEQIIDLVGYVS